MNEQEMREAATKACAMLNEAFRRDPSAMYFLQGCRVPCKENLATADIQLVVDQIPVLSESGEVQQPNYAVGMIGVITGLFESMGFPCTIGTKWAESTDNNGRPQFVGFGVVEFNSGKTAS